MNVEPVYESNMWYTLLVLLYFMQSWIRISSIVKVRRGFLIYFPLVTLLAESVEFSLSIAGSPDDYLFAQRQKTTDVRFLKGHIETWLSLPVCLCGCKKKVGGFPTVFNTVLVTTTANITLSSMTSALSDFWISTNFELATMIPETVPLRWLDWRIKHQSDKTFCHAD